MQISEVMTKAPLFVESTCRVREALAAARERGIEHLLVCDHGEVVGVACAQCELADAKLEHLVGEYMVPARGIDMGATLEEAAERMLALDVGALLVKNQGRPIGVATRGDLLRGGLICGEHTAAQFFCASCGAHAHVHADPHTLWVAYCSSCMELAAPPGMLDDVGTCD